MRKTVIILSVLALIASSCKQQATKQQPETENSEFVAETEVFVSNEAPLPVEIDKEDVLAVEMLKEFYTRYITENAKISDFDPKIIKAIENKYLSERLIQKLKAAELKADPFIEAQDFELAWIKTLEVKPLITGHAYEVCYEYTKNYIKCITLFVTKEDEKYVIQDVENEQYKSSYILSEENNYSFITKADWEGVECKYYNDEIYSYNSIQECRFPNATMQQVYNIAKRVEEDLKPELPANDLEYGDLGKDKVEVSYKYKTPKHLYIELFYNGGVTYVEIIEKEKETHLKTTWSPD